LFSPLPPLFGGSTQEFLDETYPGKSRGMGLLYGENCIILTSTVFGFSTREMNRQAGQTDGQTDELCSRASECYGRSINDKLLRYMLSHPHHTTYCQNRPHTNTRPYLESRYYRQLLCKPKFDNSNFITRLL